MNVLVIIIPILAVGMFVALWASRSRDRRRKDRNDDGAALVFGDGGSWASDSGGDGACRDGGSDPGGGDGGGGGDSGGGDGGGGGD